MNILIISFGNVNYDGRLREIIKVAQYVGQVTVISTMEKNDDCNIDNANVHTYVGKSYVEFIRFCMKECERLGSFDILIVDNRRAVIPSILVKKKLSIKYVVQDVRELYLVNEVEHFVGKLGCVIEKYLIKRADLLLCANEHRAEIMQKYYKLPQMPIVFENYRRLEYSETFDFKKYEKKYQDLFEKNTRKLISTSGCSVFRTNDKLVKDILRCKHLVELYFVGDSSDEDEKVIKSIIAENKMPNVHIIGRVKEDELKYLISKCDIGVVNYSMSDQNNLYCASGKIYEFLFEKIPVVTTNNPPLKKICDTYDVGVSGDDYAESIDKLLDNYEYYLSKVSAFIEEISIEDNNKMVAQKILQAYEATEKSLRIE